MMNDEDFGSLTYGEQTSPTYPTFSTPSYPSNLTEEIFEQPSQSEEVKVKRRLEGGKKDLFVEVTHPEKHGEGTVDAYVSYEVVTTNKGKENKVRRRYQDFEWLKKEMDREYCFSIVPPLPEKHRTEYLDRFGPVFIEKRRKALQRFMDRLTDHPFLSNAEIFLQFLEAKPATWETYKQSRKTSSIEEIGDSFMNAFTKVKFPDSKFTSIAEYNQQMSEHLLVLEKIHQRISKRQTDMCEDLTNLGGVMNLLAEEDKIGNAFHQLGQVHDRLALALGELNEKMDGDLLYQVRDYILYSESIKRALRERDGEQVTYEEMATSLEVKLGERESLSDPNQKEKSWISSLTSTDPVKLQAAIEELQKSVDESAEQNKKVSQLVLDEMAHFSKSKNGDFKVILRSYATDRLTFAQQALDQWEALLPSIEEIRVD